jgi:restriction endonuclease Mrr
MARTTADTHDLMPEMLEILKSENREFKRSEVHASIQPFIDRMKFDQRDRSIDWALNRLRKEGLVLNTRRGFWKATAKGMAGDKLSEAQAKEIMDRWTALERRQRQS